MTGRLRSVDVCDRGGLLCFNRDVDGCCTGDAVAAGEALDDTALEIIVVDVAKRYICEATASTGAQG